MFESMKFFRIDNFLEKNLSAQIFEWPLYIVIYLKFVTFPLFWENVYIPLFAKNKYTFTLFSQSLYTAPIHMFG